MKGYKACPICGEDTNSTRLQHGKKNVYISHIKFLPRHYPYKRQKKTFDDKQESGSPPHPMSGATIYNKLKDISFSSRNKCGKKLNDKTSNNYWKTRPEFFE